MVGAGLAGLAAAELLATRGADITVFEKSLGPGGRLATRRSREGPEFDHGAQLLRPTTDEFATYLDRACAADAAAVFTPTPDGWPTRVGIPGMREVVAPLARGLPVRYGTRVTAITACPRGVEVTAEHGGETVGVYDAVLVSAPAPQTAALLSGLAPGAYALAGVEMAPCWTLMLALKSPSPLAGDTFEAGSGTLATPLAWLARNTAKPARPASPECWVAHADAAYSEAMLEAEPAKVAADLAAEVLPRIDRAAADVTYCHAHRWRYALTQVPLDAPFFACAEAPVWAAGDWCLGNRADHAYASGRAAALEIASALGLAEAEPAPHAAEGSAP